MQHVPEKGGRSEVLGTYLIFFFQFCHIFGSSLPKEYHTLFTNFYRKYDNTIIIFSTVNYYIWYFYYFIHGRIVNGFEFPFLRLLFK